MTGKRLTTGGHVTWLADSEFSNRFSATKANCSRTRPGNCVRIFPPSAIARRIEPLLTDHCLNAELRRRNGMSEMYRYHSRFGTNGRREITRDVGMSLADRKGEFFGGNWVGRYSAPTRPPHRSGVAAIKSATAQPHPRGLQPSKIQQKLRVNIIYGFLTTIGDAFLRPPKSKAANGEEHAQYTNVDRSSFDLDQAKRLFPVGVCPTALASKRSERSAIAVLVPTSSANCRPRVATVSALLKRVHTIARLLPDPLVDCSWQSKRLPVTLLRDSAQADDRPVAAVLPGGSPP